MRLIFIPKTIKENRDQTFIKGEEVFSMANDNNYFGISNYINNDQ